MKRRYKRKSASVRKPRLWYRYYKLDKRRWHKEMKTLYEIAEPAYAVACAMFNGEESARLVLADIAEEKGMEYLARFLREQLVCQVKPPKKF